MKDFTDSYEQKKWELAVARHALWTSFLEKAIFESSKKLAQEYIEYYENLYPQLKKLKTN